MLSMWKVLWWAPRALTVSPLGATSPHLRTTPFAARAFRSKTLFGRQCEATFDRFRRKIVHEAAKRSRRYLLLQSHTTVDMAEHTDSSHLQGANTTYLIPQYASLVYCLSSADL